ncbi:MAG: ornithine cyclodeaminase family protein [Rhodoferax sp.]|nr:ornithine cyclodeaminase family protein [Rhodoferax sp.]
MAIRFIDARQIAQACDFPGLIAHLRAAHREPPAAVERVLMQQRSAAGMDDAVLVWPAWQPGRNLGVKVVTMFPGNRAVPAVQGVYLLFDGNDGSPQAVIDGTELTYWKTAADSALGADLLARPDARELLMVGAGALAPHLIRAYQAIRPQLRQVRVWNRSADKAQAVASAVIGTPAAMASDLEAAVRQADIVCCATGSHAPLVHGDWLRPGTHLDLVGGFTPAMREADDTAVRRARIFVDSRWFTVEHAGDLTQPIASGAITRDAVRGDLFDLCGARVAGRTAAHEITLFKSGGGAHLDLMAAQYIARAVG